MDFTPEQLKLIHQAVRYYQIHGTPFNGRDYKVCDSILYKTFNSYLEEQSKQANG